MMKTSAWNVISSILTSKKHFITLGIKMDEITFQAGVFTIFGTLCIVTFRNIGQYPGRKSAADWTCHLSQESLELHVNY